MTATTPRTMPAWSDDDAESFRELAHSFLAKECAPHEARFGEQQHVDREVWTKAGWPGSKNPLAARSTPHGKRIVVDTWGAAPSKPGTVGTGPGRPPSAANTCPNWRGSPPPAASRR